MEPPFDYLAREVQSYLPTGWNLEDETDPGGWEAGGARWIARVLDGADQAWELEVTAAEAGRHGRLEALRLAFDHIFKKALGRASILG